MEDLVQGTHYAGNPSAWRLPKGTAGARAVGSVSTQAMSESPGQREAPGAIGVLTNAAGILRVYVEVDASFRMFARPFDQRDSIWRQRTLIEHMGTLVRGRGW